MRKFIAVLLFIFWPGLILSPGQAIFFSQNKRPATVGGGPVFVNGSETANLTVGGNVTSQTLGFTTGTGHFVMAMAFVGSGLTINGATLQPSGTAMTCPTASKMVGARQTIWVCYLPNAPSGQTSVTWGYAGANGTAATNALLEYSGMSITAAPVNTTVQCPGSFTGSTTWSCGPYTATANNLVWTVCGTTFGAGALSSTSPWNVRLDEETHDRMGWIFDQLSPTAGSITAGSSYSPNPGGMYFDCMIGSFA